MKQPYQYFHEKSQALSKHLTWRIFVYFITFTFVTCGLAFALTVMLSIAAAREIAQEVWDGVKTDYKILAHIYRREKEMWKEKHGVRLQQE